MENIKDILNNRLKKTKLNKQWFPFNHLDTKGEIRIISVNHVTTYGGCNVNEIGYNIEVRFTSIPSNWKGRMMVNRPKYRNSELRHIFRWGDGECNALSIMKFLGADCNYSTVKTIKIKE